MMNPNRGEIWYCKNFGNKTKGVITGPRPALVISNDTFNACSPVVTILAISSQKKDSPVHYKINLDEVSYINCEQIHTVNKSILVRKIGELDDFQMLDIENLLYFQLGL